MCTFSQPPHQPIQGSIFKIKIDVVLASGVIFIILKHRGDVILVYLIIFFFRILTYNLRFIAIVPEN